VQEPVPGREPENAASPASEYVLLGQAVHCDALLAENEPAAHALQEEEPATVWGKALPA